MQGFFVGLRMTGQGTQEMSDLRLMNCDWKAQKTLTRPAMPVILGSLKQVDSLLNFKREFSFKGAGNIARIYYLAVFNVWTGCLTLRAHTVATLCVQRHGIASMQGKGGAKPVGLQPGPTVR
jgi:hypothetical protein